MPSGERSIRAAIFEAKKSGLVLTSRSGTLVCMTDRMLVAPGLVESFAAWRRGNQRAFLKLFNVTVEGTNLWARKIVRAPDRILFVIEIAGRPIGHIGYAEFGNGFEVCDVLRGETAPQTVMADALDTLIYWLREKGAENICLRVAADETRAIGLYHRAGFVATALVPLERRVSTEGVVWLETDDPSVKWDRFFVRMVHRAD